ncbi:uncharacterized protein N7479_010110 [Penicillium vulpinum]|uniref:Peptidase S7 domain-containing protein n=1 Tax=Penicillium vulpinum TaxID=29845 RepID=A0A1V6RV19_9EURO|nr:uncharacterized protein N7479_010110 [Penicillium vulpinum]KAJ5951697.1 hypothetical protein N7479_010110 [Penicillium vulpinum]OQE05602.1 hypothetical protein PENVUL_c023G09182 [Penicillium vulpinum]
MPKNLHQRDHRTSSQVNNFKAPDLSHTINTFPVSKNRPICRKWPSILRIILRHINRTEVCVITCVQRGESASFIGSATTGLVMYNSEKPPRHTKSSIDNILKLLHSNNLQEVAVEFIRGDFARGVAGLSGRELDRRAVQMPSLLGQSLALKDANNPGTLGGFLELKMPGETVYKTVGLTCFHCINPSEKGLDPQFLKRMRAWHKQGITPTDSMRNRLQVEHPSSMAIENKVESLKDEIHEIEGNEEYIRLSGWVSEGLQDELGHQAKCTFSSLTNILSELKGFLRDIDRFQTARRASFGPVYAASGFRTGSYNGKASTLDWALIEVPPDRVGENITPDGHYLKDSPITTKLDDIPLFIHGQRSGYSKGIKQPIEAAHLAHEIEDGQPIKPETFEHSVFFQHGFHFSEGGGSGVLVFTQSHVVVGILIGGVISDTGSAPKFSFFTPIENIIEDIKKIAKATDVRFKMNRP